MDYKALDDVPRLREKTLEERVCAIENYLVRLSDMLRYDLQMIESNMKGKSADEVGRSNLQR